MCCQPPLNRNDLDHYFEKNIALIDTAPTDLPSIGITGGEPTLLRNRLFSLIDHIQNKLPDIEIHLLTNGRAFADLNYAKKLSECYNGKILLGIPLHSDRPADHDAVTQIKGSYNETMRGLYNLARFNFSIELRIVLTKANYLRLPYFPEFIYRNLPFVTYVSIMGLEYTGYAIKNKDSVWIEPEHYQDELEQTVLGLTGWGINVSVFNLPHCMLKPSLWEYACRSISDWKTIYHIDCELCIKKPYCCGLFGTSKQQLYSIAQITKL